MFIINNIVIPRKLLSLHFSCQYQLCQGACCVMGEGGAPTSREEIAELEDHLEHYIGLLDPESQKIIKTKGIASRDSDQEWHINCQENNGPCVLGFAINGQFQCQINDIFSQNLNRSLRPLSCRLFPLRVRKWGNFRLLDFEEWPECRASWNSKIHLVKFCQDALIDQFGNQFVKELNNLISLYESSV